jgi:tetratricopeptide (TPR) repeat protein
VAKALTRSPRRRARTSDRHERELRRLLLSVCDDTGFRLYLATYDQPKRRDELIDRIVRQAELDRVRITRLDLAKAGPETNLVSLLRAHLQRADLPPDWRQAVMVTGIEQRLDYSAGPKGFAFLHQANLLRDALPEAAPVPVVLWLSRLASAALPAEAPDLWQWRAANFDFTGDKLPRVEVLRELTTLGREDDLGLSGEQRRARIGMLEDLLSELERRRPPKSKRQKAELAGLLLELGSENWHLTRAAEAIPRFERALEFFREIGDRQGEGDALGKIGNTFAVLGDGHRAIEHYAQRLAIARAIGDRRGEANAIGGLGIVYADLGKTRQSIKYFEQWVKIAREIGDRRGEGNALGNLGLAYADLGEPRQATEYHNQALMISREIGDRRAEGHDIGNLGLAYAALGDTRRAIEDYEQALAIAREIGDRGGEGNALGNLCNAYAALGEPRRAIEYCEQALTIMREIGDRRGEAQALHNSAIAFDDLGDLAEAITRMEEALRIYEEIEDPNAGQARAQLTVWDWE